MRIFGAYPGDIQAALAGDDDAKRRVVFGYYLFPRMLRELERLKLIRTPIPPLPSPPPDQHEAAAMLHALAPALLRAELGVPNPQQKTASRAALEATVAFRDGLVALSKELDKDIERWSKTAQ